MTRRLTLPTDSSVRKDIPLYSGCYTYFPAALAGVALHSKINNEKHNPGEPLRHSRGKSGDHADCIARHSMDIADFLAHRVVWSETEELDILSEANALCWRTLALSQELHEKFGAPLAPAARLPQKGETVADAVRADYLGRKIVSYSAAIHHPLCEKDTDHTGECGVSYPDAKAPVAEWPQDIEDMFGTSCAEIEPAEACSGSPASEPTPTQCDQTRAPDRVSSHDQSQELRAVPSPIFVPPHLA